MVAGERERKASPRKAKFSQEVIICQMPRAQTEPKTPLRKRGKGMKAAASANTEAVRRYRDRRLAARRMDAGLPLPSDLVVEPIQKVGRKRLPWARLKENSRYVRRLRDAAAAHALLRLAEPACCCNSAEQPVAEPEEATAAAALATMARREQRNLAEHNPEGARGLLELEPAFVPVDERECQLYCCEPRHVGLMRCCGAQVCDVCLQEWFGRHNQSVGVGYTDGTNRVVEDPTWIPGVSNFSAETRMQVVNGWGAQESGRAVPAKMDTHRCPFCNVGHETVKRAWDAARRAGGRAR